MSLSLSPKADETLDRLSNDLMILQRKKGHRATTDDVLLAWAGLTYSTPSSFLDLGTGKGTVALLLLSRLTALCGIGIEAFEQSYSLCRRNMRLNGFEERFRVYHHDLREPIELPIQRFDLITGAPPFMPIGSGILPKDEQRAAGRFEIKGGVEEYMAHAVSRLAPKGTAIILMDGSGEQRAIDAARTHRLQINEVIRVLPRPERPPTYSIIVAQGVGADPNMDTQPLRRHELCLRQREGEDWSDDYKAVRRSLNLPESRR